MMSRDSSLASDLVKAASSSNGKPASVGYNPTTLIQKCLFLDSHFVVCAHASVFPNIIRLIDGPLALSIYFFIEFAVIRCNCGNYKISKLGDMLHRIFTDS